MESKRIFSSSHKPSIKKLFALPFRRRLWGRLADYNLTQFFIIFYYFFSGFSFSNSLNNQIWAAFMTLFIFFHCIMIFFLGNDYKNSFQEWKENFSGRKNKSSSSSRFWDWVYIFRCLHCWCVSFFPSLAKHSSLRFVTWATGNAAAKDEEEEISRSKRENASHLTYLLVEPIRKIHFVYALPCFWLFASLCITCKTSAV